VNASWVDNNINLHRQVHVGIAIAVEEGVVTIVIPEAEKKNPCEIAVLRLEMRERARAGRSRPSDLCGATFTISNLGMYNVDAFTAVIPTPQAAILAVGRIVDRVVPVEGKQGVRPMMTVTMSYDHRVMDGARAARFLDDLAVAASQGGN
jgi:pyruvate dehydrogenase E2 component (dihydrolipoyllysine-residue acetyltransferase)